jgi:hypothetical protein
MPGQLTAEHVRRALLAFVASERAARQALGGGMFPSAAEVIVWEVAADADLCAELATYANDIDAIGETWATPPKEHDPVEQAAFVLLLRLPGWRGRGRGKLAAVNQAITDPAFLRAFLAAAWEALGRLLKERAPKRRGRR